jgi:hypothetical protein
MSEHEPLRAELLEAIRVWAAWKPGPGPTDRQFDLLVDAFGEKQLIDGMLLALLAALDAERARTAALREALQAEVDQCSRCGGSGRYAGHVCAGCAQSRSALAEPGQ